MKVKQKVEKSGVFCIKPDMRDLLMPKMIVCPECGHIIYPYEDDKGRVYYFPNMSTEHRYHTKHYARATFTCYGCGCRFSREANTYTEFKWDKINLDIAKLLMVLSLVTLILFALTILIHDIKFDFVQVLIILSSYVVFLVSLIYYWRNSS